MRTFLLLILDWLRQRLDLDYAADLAAYQAKRQAQQELIATESVALKAETERLIQLESARHELSEQLTELTHEIGQLETRRKELRNDLQTSLDALASVDPDDLRRQPL